MTSTARATRPQPSPTTQTVNWVIKASKLCNLRCRYCYEWDDLAKKDRLTIGGWERLLLMIRRYHELQSARVSGRFVSCLIWHGGEPMLLPRQYFEQVMSLQHRILGGEALHEGTYCNTLQSNLFQLSDDKLDLFERERFRLGVSFDVVSGVRVTANETTTEDRVVANMDKLRQRGIALGAVTVLAAHTQANLRAIYDFYASVRMNFRILPLFEAPNNTPGADFALTAAQMSSALCRLFDYWASRKSRVLVAPLDEYARTAWLHLNGAEQMPYARENGEWAIIVNTDGALFQVRDAYQASRALGNIYTHTLEQVLLSNAYRESLTRDRELYVSHCVGCEYQRACNSFPLYESAYPEPHPRRCHVAHPVIQHVVRHTRAGRFSRSLLRELCGT